ncbi:asparaginase-domain-containing protein [Microdochium trichocladiopsis]|uniref:Asparaginase-domain-containing protein n=1 Tax=Microdochium trichocladiopsis TaxID=1682393 RepID=A0A9P8YI88_9PEZI|nr:asparaginase-domain-containing protein [Microdochium trichocladiopsis]KAH7040879.1 asparaginase-domain-containing protein [Microdochium trichocladiopsis]
MAKSRPVPHATPSPRRLSTCWLGILAATSVALLTVAMLSTQTFTSGLLLWLSPTLAATIGRETYPVGLPFVINTWGGPFTAATDAAFLSLLDANTSALDAVEIGCAKCEANQCDGTVGFGGSPDENCETTLDAMIMDGTTMKSGAVAGLRRIKNVISVARHVLEHTTHTLLAGDLATEFAVANGFPEEDLSTEASREKCEAWRAAGCQPNYRLNVTPDPAASCGPYTPMGLDSLSPAYAGLIEARGRPVGHDTISMITIDSRGIMAAGTSTNGASYKVPGRVGDGPITGSGSYVDGEVGGCGATGDGDIMMRFLPCYQAVENLRNGMTPTAAAEDAVRRMVRKYPQVSSGVVVVNSKGEHGGAGSGWTFTYAYRSAGMDETAVVSVPPVDAARAHL